MIAQREHIDGLIRSNGAETEESAGRQDSNPDTQIQSSFEAAVNEEDQWLTPPKSGELRQGPQYRRNGRSEDLTDYEEDTLP